MGSWTTWFLDFNKLSAWNKRGGAKFGQFLINVVAELTELFGGNSQKINCRDVAYILEVQNTEIRSQIFGGINDRMSVPKRTVWLALTLFLSLCMYLFIYLFTCLFIYLSIYLLTPFKVGRHLIKANYNQPIKNNYTVHKR